MKKRTRSSKSGIELLLVAIIFAVIVALAFGIALALPQKNQPSPEHEGANFEVRARENASSDNNQTENTEAPINALTRTQEEESTTFPVKTISQTVPFTSQAPTGMWSDQNQQNACEEASSLMAYWWAKGKKPASSQDSLQQILKITSYEEENYGSSEDTNPTDTVKRIFKGYFHFNTAQAVSGIALQDIVQEIMKGNLVILPMDGQKLANPHYTQSGPARHMLLIIGYDVKTKEFITNDSGTKFGAGYKYPQQKVFDAIREYPTGEHAPITGTAQKSMIVVSK